MTLIELYDLAYKEKINIHKINLNKIYGLYFNNNIFINNKIKNECLEKIVLAEELGHHFMGVSPTPPFSTDYYNKLIRSKNEFKAKKWLINQVIPFDTLRRFLKQNMSKYDIAEEMDVSASLVEDAIELYKNNIYSN